MEINNKLKKFYKKYLLEKENINNNKETSYNYFKENLIILENIKQNTMLNELDLKLITKTETECQKYITKSLEYYIESEIDNCKSEIDNCKDNNYLNIIKSIEEGDITVIKQYKYGQINFFKLFNNQTLLHYAVKFGDTGFLTNSFKIGALIDTPNGEGHSLLEYACLQKDPNMINFLIKNGANMAKHLHFRDTNKKLFNFTKSIDMAILMNYLIQINNYDNISLNRQIEIKINNLKKFLILDQLIGLNKYTENDLLISLLYFLHLLNYDAAMTYLNIIAEELSYNLNSKLGCPSSKIDILLVNLIPFIDYPFNLSNEWIISLELKYLILNLIKNSSNINLNNFKNELVDLIWSKYIQTNLISENFIGTLVFQWIIKIKV